MYLLLIIINFHNSQYYTQDIRTRNILRYELQEIICSHISLCPKAVFQRQHRAQYIICIITEIVSVNDYPTPDIHIYRCADTNTSVSIVLSI